MPPAPRSYLVERLLIYAADNSDTLATTIDIMGAQLYGSEGVDITEFPAIRFSFETATEQPENSGNYNCLVEIELLDRCDFNNDTTYKGQVVGHLKFAGAVEEWIMGELEPADLEILDPDASGGDYATAFNNKLKVHNIRLMGFEKGLDAAESIMFHKWNLEVYLHEDTS